MGTAMARKSGLERPLANARDLTIAAAFALFALLLFLWRITDPGKLRERLREIRAEGFAQTEGDVQLFTGSISAPVFGSNGTLLGCICFVYMKKLAAEPARMEELKQELLMMTHAVSIGLGWHPGQVS